MTQRIMTFARPALDPVQAAPLVEDDFERVDSVDSLGVAPSGEVWEALRGTWGIDANRAYSSNTTGNTIREAGIEAGASDVRVAVDLVTDGDPWAGLVFRCVDGGNYLHFSASWLFDGWFLQKVTNGSVGGIASFAETPYLGRLEVIASGATITCKVDGVTKITVTNTTHETATKCGLRAYANETASLVRFDNFQVDSA